MPRVRKIDYSEQFSSSIIVELIQNKNVLISAQYIVNEIIKYYDRINLIESGDIQAINTILYGFPIRKSIDPSLKKKIENL